MVVKCKEIEEDVSHHISFFLISCQIITI